MENNQIPLIIKEDNQQLKIVSQLEQNNKPIKLIFSTFKNELSITTINEQNQIQQIITQEDLIGAKLNENQLIIYSLEKQNASCCKKLERIQKEYVLTEQNIQILKNWQNMIFYISKYPNFGELYYDEIINNKLPQFNEKLILYLNPVGGTKQAPKLWESHKKYFEISGYYVKEVFTNRQNHARDDLAEMDDNELSNYKGILVFSGDGLAHEVLNGLAKRKNRQLAKQIAVGHLPGGSANALCSNVCDRSNEPFTLMGAIFNVLKGQKLKIDITELTVDNNPENKLYSFLSITYAFVAEVDLNSEFLRALGDIRFDLYGAYRAFVQKSFPASLYTKIGNEQQNETQNNQSTSQQKKEINLNQQNNQIEENQQIDKQEEEKVQINKNSEIELKDNNWQLYKGGFKFLLMSSMPYIGSQFHSNPNAKMDDGFLDTYFLIDTNWVSLFSTALKFQDGSCFDKKTKKPIRKDLTSVFANEFIIEVDGDQPGLFSIDGEKLLAKQLQGKVYNKYVSVFCNDKKNKK